jgi:dTDP-4-dehydrorhamnose 3,5-epimerase
MKAFPTQLPEVQVIQPSVYADERGYFYESFNQATLRECLGIDMQFVQDNHSLSVKGVLRGLHFQTGQAQTKLVRVIRGQVFDVVVDIRRTSDNFGRWVGVELSDANRSQLWIPPGFAHGFIALSETAEVLYKTSNYYARELECTLAWNDPSIGIDWPLKKIGVDMPILSQKDQLGLALSELP